MVPQPESTEENNSKGEDVPRLDAHCGGRLLSADGRGGCVSAVGKIRAVSERLAAGREARAHTKEKSVELKQCGLRRATKAAVRRGGAGQSGNVKQQ